MDIDFRRKHRYWTRKVTGNLEHKSESNRILSTFKNTRYGPDYHQIEEVETTFGKYKNELSKNPMNGITDLALIITAFTSNLADNEIKNAIDNCTCKMLKEWKVKNLCDSLSSKREIVFN